MPKRPEFAEREDFNAVPVMRCGRLFAFMLAATAVCMPLINCGGTDMTKEPAINGNLKWNDDLPSADFPAAAEVVDVVLYRERRELGATITSLMAIVNAEQPRIALDSDDRLGVFEKMGIAVNIIEDPFDLFEKYKSYISKAVIWDEECPDTVNLASTLAGIEQALVVTADDYEALKNHGIAPKIIADYRGKFNVEESDPKLKISKQRLAVYSFMYDNYYARCTRRIITSLPPDNTVKLRDYSMAVKSAIIFLEFGGEEGQLAYKFFSRAQSGNSAVLGWAPNGDEGGIVTCASLNGMYVWASDHSSSLTYFAAKKGSTPVLPVKSVDEYLDSSGKVQPAVYVAIGISDGDNLQYMQGAMFDKFNQILHKDPKMPALSWTINPAASEVMPAVYNYFIEQQAQEYPKDGFLTGPSGIGYFYPYRMYGTQRQDAMFKFYAQTSRYLAKTGINTVSVWYQAVGDPPIPEGFMEEVAPHLPGVSAVFFQRHMEPVMDGGVMFTGWNDPYNDNPVANFKKVINDAFDDFTANPDKASFVSLQAVPWDGRMLEHFMEIRIIADNLRSGGQKGSDFIKYVTIDQLVQLQRIGMGLPGINAGH